MKLFYSITTGPLLSAFSFMAKSNNVDDALNELMDANTKRHQNCPHDDFRIHRVIAHRKDDSLNDSEARWLMVVSPRWDVEWPKTAVYYRPYGRCRYVQTSDGSYEWKLGDE